MGQETGQSNYTKEQEREFNLCLEKETKWLKQWIKKNQKASGTTSFPCCGYEAEGWIINKEGLPSAYSDQLLSDIQDSHITPELSKFNFEINGNPFDVKKSLTSQLESDFQMYWKKVSDAAARNHRGIVFIGTYPDLSLISFGMKDMFPRNRYRAINNRIKELRNGGKTHIQIEGHETWTFKTENIMQEAQTTSLQIHLKVDFSKAKDFYNSSLIASPVMSALCANSPYVWGKELWDESRIPLFEQAIPLKTKQGEREVSRVGLGAGYVKDCVSELFEQNLTHPVLLPEIKPSSLEKLEHLCLHNGTIWRWNRPIIGIDEKNGEPHFRVEHRVPSTGPTLVDMQANILFFIGLIHFIKNHIKDGELPIDFSQLERDFYNASKLGLEAEIQWIDGKKHKICDLILKKLLSFVKEELKKLSLSCERTDYLINYVIRNRVSGLRNGSSWQKGYVLRHGKQFASLMQRYFEEANKNIPVCDWSFKK